MTGAHSVILARVDRQPEGLPPPIPLLPLDNVTHAQAEAELLLEGATTEILHVAHDSPFALGPTLTTWLANLALRGVSVRTLAHHPSSSRAESLHTCMPSEGATRCTDTLPPVLLIADRQAAIIPTANHRSQALLVTYPALATLMATMFDQYWLNAAPRPPSAVDQADMTGLAKTDLALLRLLAAGHTDETAARRLNVSLRTVRRRTAAIMIQLDATSRFQAGMNAARRGWL